MDFIDASSSIMDVWKILIHPIILFLAVLITTRFIFGKKKFAASTEKHKMYIQACKNKIDFDKRFGKAASVIEVFLFLSSIYLLSILISVIIDLIRINVSLPLQNVVNKESIMNVWRYYPYVDDFFTLSRLVFYKAGELGFLTIPWLSTQGVIISVGFFINSCIILSFIFFFVYMLMFLFQMFKKGAIQRLRKIGRAFLTVLISISILAGYSFFLLPIAQQNNQQMVWYKVEESLLSSGEPIQDELSKEKIEAVDKQIRLNMDSLLNIEIGVGPFQWWIEFTKNNYSTFFTNLINP